MADIGGLDYLQLPSFVKKFSKETSMDELVKFFVIYLLIMP